MTRSSPNAVYTPVERRDCFPTEQADQEPTQYHLQNDAAFCMGRLCQIAASRETKDNHKCSRRKYNGCGPPRIMMAIMDRGYRDPAATSLDGKHVSNSNKWDLIKADKLIFLSNHKQLPALRSPPPFMLRNSYTVSTRIPRRFSASAIISTTVSVARAVSHCPPCNAPVVPRTATLRSRAGRQCYQTLTRSRRRLQPQAALRIYCLTHSLRSFVIIEIVWYARLCLASA